jgi:hypothetical protein
LFVELEEQPARNNVKKAKWTLDKSLSDSHGYLVLSTPEPPRSGSAGLSSSYSAGSA